MPQKLDNLCVLSNPLVMKSSSLFRTADGRNHFVTFALVSSLFLLWGFCNGMIDVMDKHFQEELHLTLAQSAWVQFAHYLGYFLMALPAGWLATKLGYRGGIIAGLLMVAVGGLWFIPATQIAQFWAFLLGVCLIAAGLTFLEAVANPYTTVLGAPDFCRHADQPRAIMQWHRLDFRADCRRDVFLLHRRERQEHWLGNTLDAIRWRCRRRAFARFGFCQSSHAGPQIR
jgi:hypothetical protein